MSNDNLEILNAITFEKKKPSIITVMGVGGAGGNAVNHMHELGIEGVTFMICNTDGQALRKSPVELQIQLGTGLGAGNNPEIGSQAALESLNDIMYHFEEQGTEMVFITAGMGGGTGTGAAPVIAKAAKDRGILTVGITTLPFLAEGKKRVEQAYKGLEKLNENVDALVVIHNDNIAKIYGQLPFEEAFGKADDVLAIAAKGIAELITRHGLVNVDFADVKAVMLNSGMALTGSARASGPNKIDTVVNEALNSPLLNQQDIRGAKDILINISYGGGNSLTFGEATQILEMIQKRVGSRSSNFLDAANLIWGAGRNSVLAEDEIELTIVATGFESVHPITMATHPQMRKSDNNEEQMPPKEVLIVPEKNRYEDIEKVWAQPAYLAQNKKLWDSTNSTTRSVEMKNEPGEQEDHNHADNGDLFS